jgi:thiosulfate/3-mercaptopyruvate sulfurtransferase
MHSTLVSADWLAEHIDDVDLRILDASYFLPTVDRNADREFVKGHIPGALRFDIEEISDPEDTLPHMLPTAEQFEHAMQGLGVGEGMQIVVYDALGLFSAARAWWMFRYFGHDTVAVLDGGLPAWVAAGGGLQEGRGRVRTPPYPFRAKARSGWVVDAETLLEGMGSDKQLILDARARGRFIGRDPEPRPGMRAGHIPGSTNVPFMELLDPETKQMKPRAELLEIFANAGVDDQPIVVSCGSGVTACVLALGLEVCGLSTPALYDGSWSEWGIREDLPIEQGN